MASSSSSPPSPPPPPVGEDNWVDYLEQQRRHADTLKSRLRVIENYRNAANAERGSIKVWLAYCDYFWALHRSCHDPKEGESIAWAKDDLRVVQSVFTLDAALHLWSQGHDETKFRLSDSHELWDRWISLERELLDRTKTPEGVKRITHLYRNRLLTPHLTWDETSSMFSSFLSEYNPSAYEEIMKDITTKAKDVRSLCEVRDKLETNLKTAARSGDVDAHKEAMKEYISFEMLNARKERKRQDDALRLAMGIFSRALTGPLATDEDAWTDFVVFVSQLRSVFGEGIHKNDELCNVLPNLLDTLQRAVQHCPWSGTLWSRYILAGEEATLSFSDMERIKHAATNSSQLDRDGMTGVVDMYAAWCGYLKRTAMHPRATDEAVDIADSGLVAALEAVQVWGERRFKDEYQGDPNYRLERILIQYLFEKHDATEAARDQWKKLAVKDLYANSYDFWLHYFMWEMLVFQAQKGKTRSPTPSSGNAKELPVPTLATQVLERALHNHNLDWPERVMDVYLHHCNDYQTSETLRKATDTMHKVKKAVAKRREREAAEQQAAAAAAYATYASAAEAQVSGESPSGKRKWDGESTDGAESATKKVKTGAGTSASDDTGSTQGDQKLKRDRENTTVIVSNLPADVTATKVKQYFKDYGHINHAQVKQETDGKSSAALIEFRSIEDVQSALIRDGKYFGEHSITVKPATNLTLFVTNFPPEADDDYIRSLFSPAGDLFAVRWPSLKFNTRRRFCYVAFRDEQSSAQAIKLNNGKILGDKFELKVMYSDPTHRKERQGAAAEGREVHVKNVDLAADETAISDIFSKYGTVASVRIVRTMAGKSRGSAFVTMGSKEEAKTAIAELHNTKFQSQILTVEPSVPSNYKPTAKEMGDAPTPGSDEMMTDQPNGKADDDDKDSKAERSFAILNLPDTVNVARVRRLMEPHGSVVKVVLRPDHGGAIVEMSDSAAAGKAQLSVEGLEMDGGKLRTSTVAELFQHKNGAKEDPAAKKKRDNAAAAAALMPPPPRVKRPVLGKGTNKRGGAFTLVMKGSGGSKSGTSINGEAANTSGAKTNDEFRKLLLGGKNGEETNGR